MPSPLARLKERHDTIAFASIARMIRSRSPHCVAALLTKFIKTCQNNSRIKIDSITDLSFEARLSDRYMIETRGTLIEKIKRFAPNGDLHNFDMSLFWGAIRNNVKVRAHAFKK